MENSIRPLDSALNELSATLDVLNDRVIGLKDRLSPVLNNDSIPTDPEVGANIDEDTHSHVVRDINSKTEWVKRLSNDINELIYHLDV